MQETYRCAQCSSVFNSKSARKLHVRSLHQSSIRLTNSHGSTISIEKINGQFTCPQSTYGDHAQAFYHLDTDTENGSWRDQTQQGWVQTLLHHNHRRFFHVLPEKPSHEEPLQSCSGKQPSHEEPLQSGSGTTIQQPLPAPT
ncbi:hypothetical protein VP01_2406g1 [Puccinia sorghi]|uniref:C2H2-type domain-containing protein n=1 Tax=Puccinia sorghi TaxID=27349 RepID=A0A0L6V6T6_9BASI|nr:hypothetical protein VP01_2406g1 [Puccinia sorghi]